MTQDRPTLFDRQALSQHTPPERDRPSSMTSAQRRCGTFRHVSVALRTYCTDPRFWGDENADRRDA